MDFETAHHLCTFFTSVSDTYLDGEDLGEALIEKICSLDSIDLGSNILKLVDLLVPSDFKGSNDDISCVQTKLRPFFQFYERVGCLFDHGESNNANLMQRLPLIPLLMPLLTLTPTGDANFGADSRLAGIVVDEETGKRMEENGQAAISKLQ
jgi:hypothetical protein